MTSAEALAELSLEEQAHWWVEQLRYSDMERNAAFLNWVKESPSHIREFLHAYAFEEAILTPMLDVWRASASMWPSVPDESELRDWIAAEN